MCAEFMAHMRESCVEMFNFFLVGRHSLRDENRPGVGLPRRHPRIRSLTADMRRSSTPTIGVAPTTGGTSGQGMTIRAIISE